MDDNFKECYLIPKSKYDSLLKDNRNNSSVQPRSRKGIEINENALSMGKHTSPIGTDSDTKHFRNKIEINENANVKSRRDGSIENELLLRDFRKRFEIQEKADREIEYEQDEEKKEILSGLTKPGKRALGWEILNFIENRAGGSISWDKHFRVKINNNRILGLDIRDALANLVGQSHVNKELSLPLYDKLTYLGIDPALVAFYDLNSPNIAIMKGDEKEEIQEGDEQESEQSTDADVSWDSIDDKTLRDLFSGPLKVEPERTSRAQQKTPGSRRKASASPRRARSRRERKAPRRWTPV